MYRAWRHKPLQLWKCQTVANMFSLSYNAFRRRLLLQRFFGVMFKVWGIKAAALSTSDREYSLPGPQHRMTAFAFIVPNVIIWATLLFPPYFSLTYWITFSRPSAQKSISKIGHGDSFGVKKFSQIVNRFQWGLCSLCLIHRQQGCRRLSRVRSSRDAMLYGKMR